MQPKRTVAMNNKWQERLSEILKENNARAGGEKDFTDPTKPTHTTHTIPGEISPTAQNPLTQLTQSQDVTSNPEDMGLVAAWSGEFGFVSLHDPTTGEWHDIATKDAPDWAVSEAFRRKDLYKGGNRRAYRLTSREMEELWEAEHLATEDEGIIEEHPVE